MDTIIFLEEDLEVEEQMAREMSMEDNTGSYNNLHKHNNSM